MVCYPCPSGSDEATTPRVQSKPDKELTDDDDDDDDDDDLRTRMKRMMKRLMMIMIYQDHDYDIISDDGWWDGWRLVIDCHDTNVTDDSWLMID